MIRTEFVHYDNEIGLIDLYYSVPMFYTKDSLKLLGLSDIQIVTVNVYLN